MPAALDCKGHYEQLHAKCGDVLAETFCIDTDNQHSKSHSKVLDLEEWISVLSSRPEADLLKAGVQEYQFALLAVVQGQYRQAFMALRFFMELTLSAVYFSSNELELRLWLRGERDIFWEPLVNNDSGIFSKRFVRAFCEPLVDESLHYGVIARKLYRECSEYVHGKAQLQKNLPDTIEFNHDIFVEWHEKAQSAFLIISFALCVRYLQFLDNSTRNKLETIIIDELGHIKAIQFIFSGTTENA